jgi:PEP-CTERM motif-containing protein
METVLAVLLCLVCTSVLRGQAFQNLDFESATLVPIPGDSLNRVYFSLAFPGWNGFSGTNQQSAVLHDAHFLDSTGILIMDSNYPSLFIQGNYAATLEAGVQLGSSTTPADASLSQTGLVPSGTKSLSFLATTYDNPFAVSLASSNLNLISFPIASQNYRLYEADISAFAGQIAELEFTLFAQNPHVNPYFLSLDDIQFSPEAVPEPSALSLLMIGVGSLIFLHRTHHKTA